METLSRRVESQKTEYEHYRTDLDSRLEQIENSIAAVKKTLDALGVEIEGLGGRLGAYEAGALTGPVARKPAMVREASAAEKAKKLPEPAVADEPGADDEVGEATGDPGEVYRMAQDALSQEDYSEAIRLFSLFIDAFPEHQFTDNAQFWIGECYYRAGEFEKAIDNYNKVVEDFPQGSKVADAILRIGLLYKRAGNLAAASDYLKTVVAKYPYSDAALKANDALKSLEHSEESAP